MNTLTVLDFEDGLVYQYDIGTEGWNPDTESCEEFLTKQGHNLKNCEWMAHSDDTINKIKIEL